MEDVEIVRIDLQRHVHLGQPWIALHVTDNMVV
jgi:hypothetical protein